MGDKLTESFVVGLLRKRYCTDTGNGPAAVLVPQVRNAAGFDATRTADALVMQLWPSRGLHLEGFEVKCSRADVLKELRQPEKAETIARFCDKWWLVVAEPSFVKDDELPSEWGLMAVSKSRTKINTIKVAPERTVPAELPKTFLAALLRQADRELARPGEEEIQAAYQRGVETGKSAATYDVRDHERLVERVAQFTEQTGIDLTEGRRFEEQVKVVKLLLGQGSWSSIVSRLERLSAAADELRADLVEGGLE